MKIRLLSFQICLPLPDRSKNFRPDIWFINEDRISHRKTVNIIEITCPYSMMFDTPSGRKSTLEIRRTNKINKYTPLIDDICSSWNVDACLHIIVVSSLGVVPKETIITFRNIFHSDKRAISVARRCVIAAIKGSWTVFFGKDLNAPFLNSLDRNNDLTDSSQNHLTDEEDGDIL